MMAVHFVYSWPVVYAEKNDQQTRRRTEEQSKRERKRGGYSLFMQKLQLIKLMSMRRMRNASSAAYVAAAFCQIFGQPKANSSI